MRACLILLLLTPIAACTSTEGTPVDAGKLGYQTCEDSFACGERPFGRRPLYPDDLVDPACPVKSLIYLFLRGPIVFQR